MKISTERLRISFLFCCILLLSADCFSQVVTPRQYRLDRKIDRLVKKRYDSMPPVFNKHRELSGDSLRIVPFLFADYVKLDDSIIKLNLRVDSSDRVAEKYNKLKKEIAGHKDKYGEENKFYTYIIKNDSIIDTLISSGRKTLISDTGLPGKNDATGSSRVRPGFVTRTFHGSGYMSTDLFLNLDKKIIRRLKDSLLTIQFKDSVSLNMQADTINMLKGIIGDKENIGKKQSDSIQNLQHQNIEAGNEMQTLRRNLSLAKTPLIVGAVMLGIIVILAFFISLRRKREFKFFPCFVMDIQEKVVFADVYDKKTNSSELRKFEAAPLKGIINGKEDLQKTFKLFILSRKGRKEFVYKNGDKGTAQLFIKHYKRMDDEYKKRRQQMEEKS